MRRGVVPPRVFILNKIEEFAQMNNLSVIELFTNFKLRPLRLKAIAYAMEQVIRYFGEEVACYSDIDCVLVSKNGITFYSIEDVVIDFANDFQEEIKKVGFDFMLHFGAIFAIIENLNQQEDNLEKPAQLQLGFAG